MADAIDELYDLPPGEFTAARDALVKQLRAEKRRDEATSVKSLRRPTVPAWAVNQVARRRPELVDALVAAGTALAAAQRRALSGVKDSGMRRAAKVRREAVEGAWAGAAEILRGAEIDPAAHRQAISDTFEAATADTEAADEIRAGRLSKELPPPSGFGAVAGFSVVADEAAPEPATTGPDEPDSSAAAEEARHAAQREADLAQRRAAEATQRLDALELRSGDARQAAVRAVAEAQRLEARAQQARERADELVERANLAETEAAAAQQEVQRLVAEADDAAERASGQG